jgi:hypothetical protein
MLIGFAYIVPPALIWIALTRHTPPVPSGTVIGTGVYAGSGVAADVAVTPLPTKT